jgi:peptide/nickel transport system permease protein
MGLRRYLLKRIIYTVILVFGVITINFFIFQAMPGNQLEAYIRKSTMTKAEIQKIINAFGLDKPWYVQYPVYIKSMLTFNFGVTDLQMGDQAVSSLIFDRLGNTVLLIGSADVLAVIVGILLGAFAAHERGKMFDSVSILTSLATFSLPTFWMALVAQSILGFGLGWLPIQGWQTLPPVTGGFFPYWLDRLHYVILPGIVLFLFTYGGFLLLTRACVLETMTEDYVLTARAKGVKERTILLKHILKNASLPIITNVALQFGFMLSGAIITENVFQYSGLGTLIFNAINLREVPVMQAVFYIIALCIIMANLVADLLYGLLDPRIRYG